MNVDFLLADEVEKQVERALVALELNVVRERRFGRGHRLVPCPGGLRGYRRIADSCFGFETLRAEDSLADALHGLLCRGPGLGGAVGKNPFHSFGMRLIFEAARADGGNPFDKVVGHRSFALDAADGSRPASLR